MVATKATTALKQMIADPEILVAPSAYDALSVRIIQSMGFKAIHLTGSGATASMLGLPDIGLATMTEMADAARHAVAVSTVPVFGDADSGHGNALNVYRTITELERTGLAGVHLEDQPTPKRCGHYLDKQVVSTEEMVGKIRAAVAARSDPDFQIIARTDARECIGFDEAIRRSVAYAEAGADCIFFEAPKNAEELRKIRAEVDAPLLANMVEGGKTERLSVAELQEIGFNLVIFPLSGWMAAAVAVRQVYLELKNTGTTEGFWRREGFDMSFEELFELMGYEEQMALQEEFVVK
jgi:carboxyvinyl-carboxyphosphonate phosphorylmutase